MNGFNSINRSYIGRRKKEYFSLLVVGFLKAYNDFNGIYRDFLEYRHDENGPSKAALFERIKNLEEILFFDIEKKSHFLFRDEIDKNNKYSEIQAKYDDLNRYLASKDSSIRENEVKNTFSELRKSLLNKSIDSNIRRIFHILMILKENFYESEYHDVQYAQEHKYVVKIESLFNKPGHELNDSERHEFNHIKEIDKLNRKIITDTKNHTKLALDRCKTLFHETSEILLHIVHESRKNEILILNLLIERELVDKIYGCNAHERIFSQMYKSMPNLGNTGLEKAINYCKYNCGNITGLPEEIKYLLTNNSEGSQRIKEHESFKKTVECYFQEN
jgi:hypothetical protein